MTRQWNLATSHEAAEALVDPQLLPAIEMRVPWTTPRTVTYTSYTQEAP
jgi:DNA-directed RNA polymerase